MSFAYTDIVTIDGSDALTDAGFLGRDCAFPITRIEKTLLEDQVIAQMPMFIGYWNTGTIQPVLLTQTFDVDTSVVIDDCDTAEVSADLTEGELIAPDQVKIKLASKNLQVDKLIPAFCRTRNILPADQRNLLNGDGTLNTGSPYSIDFARFVFSSLARTFSAILADRLLRGDASEDFGLDGLYTQLENGWEQGSPTVPVGLNKASTFSWGAKVGTTPGTPDMLIDASQTFTLQGAASTPLPVDYNLAQFLEDFYIPFIEAHWAKVENWEIHVPAGMARCLVRTAACLQPCNNADGGIWDTEMRTRYADLNNRMVVRLYPSGREIVILESPHVEANTMWIGPRSIDGRPTYAAVWRDMDEMFSSLGILQQGFYGGSNGQFVDSEPLLTDLIPGADIPFEGRVIRQDVTKSSIDCVRAGLMGVVGVLAFERHLWLKLTDITCATYVEALTSGVNIDGTPVETHS